MELATLHLDTYKVVKLLQSKGYSEAEAEGFIAAIQEITLSGAATKSDIAEVLKDMADIKTELKQDIAGLKNEMLKFQVVQTVAIVGVMVALFQVF